MTIAFSQFINCSSIYGGGAVAATAFVCYGLAAPFSTSVYIADSSFTQCSSDGSGGAVFAASQSAMLNVMYSTFDSCKSNGMGGALAAFTGAVARVTGSMFSGNSASGHGGGAVYVQYAQLTLHGVVAYDNIAFAGGGGALYWQNLLPPIIVPWCREGTFPDPDFECTPARCANSCLPCIAGTYQSSIGVETNESCTFCAAGTFSSSPGATVCTTCEQGKFSSAVGATTCSLCPNGSFTGSVSSSSCSICSMGTFSSFQGSSLCLSCFPGYYSSSTGSSDPSDCVPCSAGSFAVSPASSSCDPCGPGLFSGQNSSECTSCPAGAFSSASESTSCWICGPGSYTFQGASVCEECMQGTYSSKTGATDLASCVACNPGMFSSTGASFCLPSDRYRSSYPSNIFSNGSVLSIDIALPFAFPFYCKQYSIAAITAYGVVGFKNTTFYETNEILPPDVEDLVFVAAFWQKLSPPTSGGFMQWSDVEQIVFQWTNWSTTTASGTDGPLTFQVALFKNGTVLLSYVQLEGVTSYDQQVIVGIQDDFSELNISLSDPQLYTGACIRISPNANQCSKYTIDQYRCANTLRLIPICAPGKYLGSNFQCQDCPSGTYQTGEGMTTVKNCTLCEVGKYFNGSGAISAADCTVESESLRATWKRDSNDSSKQNISNRFGTLLKADLSEVKDFKDHFNFNGQPAFR